MDGTSKQEKPPNVSDKLWQKFVELREKREAITKGSTQRRIDRLKADIIATVSIGLGSPEEVKAVLGDVNPTDCGGHHHARVQRNRKRRRDAAEAAGDGLDPPVTEPPVAAAAIAGSTSSCGIATDSLGAGSSSSSSYRCDVGTVASTSAAMSNGSSGPSRQLAATLQGGLGPPLPPTMHRPPADVGARWKSVESFLDPDADRSRGVPLPTAGAAAARAASRPQSGLEERIEEAIAAKNYAEAEELSDRLCVRQLGERISKAVDAHEFLEAKGKVAKSSRSSLRKKKKLKWGFEPKERWEMKANM